MHAADSSFAAILDRINSLEQALNSKVSSNKLQSYVSKQIDKFTQNINTRRVCGLATINVCLIEAREDTIAPPFVLLAPVVDSLSQA